MPKAALVLKVFKVLKEMMVLMVRLVPKDQLEQMVHREVLGLKVQPAHKAPLARREP